MKGIVWIVGLGLLIQGCSTSGPKPSLQESAESFDLIDPGPAMRDAHRGLIEADAAAKAKLEEDITDAQRAEIEHGLTDTLAFCEKRLNSFEGQSNSQAKWSLGVALAGVVAGSVAAPYFLAADAVKYAKIAAGLSGFAGAANVAGRAIESAGLSGSAAASTRNQIVKAMMAEIAVATDGTKSFDVRKGGVLRARANCILYEIAVPHQDEIPKTKPSTEGAKNS